MSLISDPVDKTSRSEVKIALFHLIRRMHAGLPL
jgi:hypothetical protein